MTTHPNYYRDDLGGQSVYRCTVCKYDTFNLEGIRAHRLTHPLVPILSYDEVKLSLYGQQPLDGLKIVIGILTSNADWPIAEENIKAAVEERARLRHLGAECRTCLVDNGSTRARVGGDILIGHMQRFNTNMGQSIARNYIIDYAVDNSADYLLMLDGDIQVVPYSGLYLTKTLEWLSHGCIGMFSRNCTSLPDDGIADTVNEIQTVLTDPAIAWTQYGMFNCKMFRKGIRFDINPVFQGEGWGYEDDDLYMQMLAAGWTSVYTNLYRYGHYNLHGSLAAMDPTLAAKVFQERQKYLLNKWGDNLRPDITEYVHRIANQQLPVLTNNPVSATL